MSGTTTVKTARGGDRQLRRIEVGDRVLARDPATGELRSREVTRVWVHRDRLVELAFVGGRVTTTGDHPFWSETDHAWRGAGQLEPGERVATADGGSIRIAGLDRSSAHRGTAYNLTVKGLHVYYVGRAGMLVHNVCRVKRDPNAVGPHSTWKTDAEGNITGYTEWAPNPKNPSGFDEVKRFDAEGGGPHFNTATGENVPTPHIHENIPGGVRAAEPGEIPRGGN